MKLNNCITEMSLGVLRTVSSFTFDRTGVTMFEATVYTVFFMIKVKMLDTWLVEVTAHT